MDSTEVPTEYLNKQWWDLQTSPSEIKYQYFGFELSEEDLMKSKPNPEECIPPDVNILKDEVDTGFSKVINNSHRFEIQLSVKYFSKENIEVTVADGMIIIRCHHESVDEGAGKVSRKVERSYIIPKECNTEVKTCLFPGVLRITCEKDVEQRAKEMPVEVEVKEFDSSMDFPI